MGHVISCGLDLISSGKGIHTDQELKSSLVSLEGLAARSNITNRERLHVKAVKEWAQGNTVQAYLTCEDILMENPTDMFALKMAHDSYFQRFNRKGDTEMEGKHATLWVDGLALTVLSPFSIQSVFSLSCVEDPAFLSEEASQSININQYFIYPHSVNELIELVQNTYVPENLKILACQRA